MSKIKSQPILYILMRTDIISLNPGKAMAQSCHAANKCVYEIQKGAKHNKLKAMLHQWQDESGNGFGTTIVFDAGNMVNIKNIVTHVADPFHDVEAGIVLDDTYPLKDGDVLHLFPLETCGYIFADKQNNNVRKYLDKLPLHP